LKYILFLPIVILLSLYSCKKKSTPAPVFTPAPVAAPTPNFYFTGTIDGESVDINDLSLTAGSGAGQSASASGQHEQSMVLSNPLAGAEQAGVFNVKTFPGSVTLCSEVESMFKVGTYVYANPNAGIDGIGVYYIDAGGMYWTSYLDSNIVQGGKFEILTHTASTDDFSKYVSTAKFSCTLFDPLGNTMQLTNGEIKSRSVNCLSLN
jgi:hypothetical protein|tara:strand:- start:11557 stop:12177 length:621 start_codon:yes stop_codon:yes gene_type:complete